MSVTPQKKQSERVVLPPKRLDEMMSVSHFLENAGSDAMLLGPDGEQIELPLEAYRILVDVVTAMSQSKAISVVPIDEKLTTQEAADLLGMSRPTLIKMLERGEIDYELIPGSRHRRVRVADIVKYQESARRRRRQILADMMADAETDGLYDNLVAEE